MNAGKSTTLLQSAYNYRERGMDVLLLKSAIDTRSPVNIVDSRLGVQAPCFSFDQQCDLFDYVKKHIDQEGPVSCVLVDEAQFLTKGQVQQLSNIVTELNIPVLAYGLRTDFQGEPFPGSKYLLAWAEVLTELKTVCHCGKKATMNMRIDEQGNKVQEGEQIEIGDNDRYIAVCRVHFNEGTSQ